MDYKNHITGPGYSIQGNILLGQVVLDSMESRFLNTPGDLACRLMADMQGAKMVVAGTRCTQLGISSVSAFIRVANPSDTGGAQFHLNISINTFPNYQEPIDSLQERFDLWGGCISSSTPLYEKNNLMIFPNPVENTCTIRHPGFGITGIELINSMGTIIQVKSDVYTGSDYEGLTINTGNLPAGIYFLRASSGEAHSFTAKILKL